MWPDYQGYTMEDKALDSSTPIHTIFLCLCDQTKSPQTFMDRQSSLQPYSFFSTVFVFGGYIHYIVNRAPHSYCLAKGPEKETALWS